MIFFRKKDIGLICEQAKAQYPNECCGVLLGEKDRRGDVRVLDLYKAANIQTQEQQRGHFLIDPLELVHIEREIQEKKIEIVGFYHSHPDCRAIASKEDEAQMLPGYVYFIVSVYGAEQGERHTGGMNCFAKAGIADKNAIREEYQITD